MANPQEAIFIHGDGDDKVDSLLDSQPPRSSSVISSTSTKTMRAESSEPEAVPEEERLSLQPQSNSPNLLCDEASEKKHINKLVKPSLMPQSSQSSTPINQNVSPTGESSIFSQEVKNSECRGQQGPFRPFAYHNQKHRPAENSLQAPEVIDLEEDEPEVEIRTYNKDEDELIDIDEYEAKLDQENLQEPEFPQDGRSSRSRYEYAIWNAPIELPMIELESFEWKDGYLKARKTVELVDGSFLKIKAVVKNLETDKVRLHGWWLKRSRMLCGILPLKANELYIICDVDLDDPRPAMEQSILSVELEDLMRFRQLICTNRPFPECRFKNEDVLSLDPKEQKKCIEENGRLVARWKFTTEFDDSRAKAEYPNKRNNFRRRLLESLNDDECCDGYSIAGSLRRYLWRGETALGGSSTMKRSDGFRAERKVAPEKIGDEQNPINLLSDDEHECASEKKKKGKSDQNLNPAFETEQVYSYGDGYSGAGGTIRGALMAKLDLIWGLDFNPDACSTLRANFPQLEVFEMWVDGFVALPDPSGRLFVDILHLSPPCQVFSPVHTREGQNDEMNFASLFGVQTLIQKARPRIVTLEQTFGILYLKFTGAFNQLIRMFTDNGFSTSWQIVEFQRFGLAQRRKRLIIVAACPGEALPELPAYTHSEQGGNGLKKYTSVRSVLSSIPPNASNHNLVAARGRGNYYQWDDSSITTCITTQWGKGHPSGDRAFTHRELAALQGFPHEHFFTAKAISKQIGNAVPPSIAKIIFDYIREHLEKVDAAEKQSNLNN